MAIGFIKDEYKLLLKYIPYNDTEWIYENLEDEFGEIKIEKVFYFKKKHLIENIDDDIIFLLGEFKNDYYIINKEILGLKYDLKIFKNFEFDKKYFRVYKSVSIFKRLEELSNQQIIIGGNLGNSIPIDIFINIIDSLPTYTEINYYIDKRITNILSEYLEGVNNSSSKYEKYLEKRNKFNFSLNNIEGIYKYEIEKYNFILELLKNMLANYESYSEKQWEKKILNIVLILFPKYVKVFNSVPLKDFYFNKKGKPKNREIDLVLLDSNSNLDLIEIKKPSDNDLVTKKYSSSRDNHIPMRSLASAIMQLEKYIFHLNKWGKKGEEYLSHKYGLDIKITNPKGLLIMGRSYNLNNKQKFDFEIIKRQYSNIVDIITYDDLIERLENLIKKFKKGT